MGALLDPPAPAVLWIDDELRVHEAFFDPYLILSYRSNELFLCVQAPKPFYRHHNEGPIGLLAVVCLVLGSDRANFDRIHWIEQMANNSDR